MIEAKMTVCPHCGDPVTEGIVHDAHPDNHAIVLLPHGFVAQLFYWGQGNEPLPVEERR